MIIATSANFRIFKGKRFSHNTLFHTDIALVNDIQILVIRVYFGVNVTIIVDYHDTSMVNHA